jgi:hypothetical protein
LNFPQAWREEPGEDAVFDEVASSVIPRLRVEGPDGREGFFICRESMRSGVVGRHDQHPDTKRALS